MRARERRGSAHHSGVPLGGFKTVDLNVVGWAVLLGPGVALGAATAVVADLPVFPAVVFGAIAAFVTGRILDEWHDRRRYLWVPVVDASEAEGRLHAEGVPTYGATSVEVDGRTVEYVAVRQRDSSFAGQLVGLPHESRRGWRRWAKARRAATLLPPPR
jgi:hypothetical protein